MFKIINVMLNMLLIKSPLMMQNSIREPFKKKTTIH